MDADAVLVFTGDKGLNESSSKTGDFVKKLLPSVKDGVVVVRLGLDYLTPPPPAPTFPNHMQTNPN